MPAVLLIIMLYGIIAWSLPSTGMAVAGCCQFLESDQRASLLNFPVPDLNLSKPNNVWYIKRSA